MTTGVAVPTTGTPRTNGTPRTTRTSLRRTGTLLWAALLGTLLALASAPTPAQAAYLADRLRTDPVYVTDQLPREIPRSSVAPPKSLSQKKTRTPAAIPATAHRASSRTTRPTLVAGFAWYEDDSDLSCRGGFGERGGVGLVDEEREGEVAGAHADLATAAFACTLLTVALSAMRESPTAVPDELPLPEPEFEPEPEPPSPTR